MKKNIFSLIMIILIIVLTIYILYFHYPRSIKLLNDSNYTNINGIFVGDDINIDNKYDVKKIISFINSLKKTNTMYYHQTNKTPDISLSLIKDTGNVDNIYFYGTYMVYNNSQYIIDYYEVYDRFEELIR